jgi:peptidoglycan glycosyltransferase
MTNNIQRLAQSILLGFALVAVSLLYWQVARAPELTARDDNPRLVQAELRLRRGRLLSRHGEVLAYSEPTETGDTLQRRYPRPEAAHVAGYYSLRYGAGGAEAAYDATLRGELTSLDQLLHRPQTGHDATLSVHLAAQRAANRSLGEHRGAVVLLDLITGEVLALVSHPAYDPNTLEDDWDALAANPEAPLLNRATQGVYPVGDLARWVGLAGLLSAGITTPLDPLNTPLDDMLAPLSASGYLATAHQLGFDAAPPFDLPTGPGLLPDFNDDRRTPRDLGVTPLHMARFAAAIAGDGRMPVPTLAYPILPSSPDRAFASGVAASLQAVASRFDGIAGWAGVATPQETGDRPLSWFVGYAPADTPRFAIAVVVEGNDGGANVTLPIVQQTVGAIESGSSSYQGP